MKEISPLFDADKGAAGPPLDNKARLVIPESPVHRVDQLLSGLMDPDNPRIFSAQDLEQHREGLRLQMEAAGFHLAEIAESPENRVAMQSGDMSRLNTRLTRGWALFVANDGLASPDQLTQIQQTDDHAQIAAFLDGCHISKFRRWAQHESRGQPSLDGQPDYKKRKGVEHLAVILLGFAAGVLSAEAVREEILWRVGRKSEKPLMKKVKAEREKMDLTQSNQYDDFRAKLDKVRSIYEIPPPSDETNRPRYQKKASPIPRHILSNFTQALVMTR